MTERAVTSTGTNAKTSLASQIAFGKAIEVEHSDAEDAKAMLSIEEFQSSRVKLELFTDAYRWFNFSEYKAWHKQNSWVSKRRHKSNMLKLRESVMQRLRDKSEVES